MSIHKAHIIQESIENLGPNGMAFSVICCDDPKTIHRHTVQHAHTMTDAEFRALLTRYVKKHSSVHAASERNHRRFHEMAGAAGVCGVCSHDQ